MTYTDRSHSAARPSGELVEDTESVRGHVDTPHGIVAVSGGHWTSNWGANQWLALSICLGGRRHVRRFDRLYAPRHIVTLAAKFAAEIVGGTP